MASSTSIRTAKRYVALEPPPIGKLRVIREHVRKQTLREAGLGDSQTLNQSAELGIFIFL
jgi:hypothetical protein